MMGAVARLRAAIGLDSSEFKAGTNRVKGDAGALQQTMGKVGGAIKAAFSIGAVTLFARSVFNSMAGISKAAENLNMGAKEFAGLSVTAAKAGTDVDTLKRILTRIQSVQSDVAKGNKAYEESLARLGINVRDFISASPDEALLLISRAAQTAATPVADLGDLLGWRLGGRTKALLNALAKDGIGSITDELAKAIDKVGQLNDEFDKLKASIKLTATSAFAGAYKWLEDGMSRSATHFFTEGEFDAPQAVIGPELEQPLVRASDTQGKSPAEEAAAELNRVRDEYDAEQDRIRKDKINADLDKQADAVKRDITRLEEQKLKVEAKPIGGGPVRGISTDSMIQTGSAVGGFRPDIRVAEKSLELERQHLEVSKENNRLTAEIVDLQRRLEAVNSGRIL